MEAQTLMHNLKEFERPKPAIPVFTDPGRVREGGREGGWREGGGGGSEGGVGGREGVKEG